jgi:hypothetical protein
MKSPIAAAALLLGPAAASAQTAPAAPAAPAAAAAPAADSVANIYGTALGPGWQSWPWDKTTTELSVELNGSARRPIKVQPSGWGALFLHHEAFDTTPYRGISFLIQVVGAPMKVQVIGLVGGKPIPDKAKVIDVAPGGWKKVEFALGDIGAAKVQLDGLWFQNFSAEPGPAFYVTEIKLEE